jgi:excisionase family DNA binding protein
MASTADEFLTVEELADLLKVPIKSIYRWQLHRTGPRSHKVGRFLRFTRRDVDAWLESRSDPRPAA